MAPRLRENPMKLTFWNVLWLIALVFLVETCIPLFYTENIYADLPIVMYTNKIDVVFTWCNGSDPNYLAQRKRTAELLNFQEDTKNRFRYHEELQYSLRSIAKFAPWIRHIYIVSDEVPTFLNISHPKIKMVPLKDIFADKDNTPNFNSQAIESQIHHIPGLSEKFIYMNDDFFFNQPTTPATFMDGQLRHKVLLNKGRLIPGGQGHWRPHVAGAQQANGILDSMFSAFERKNRWDHAHAPQLYDRPLLSMLEQMDTLASLWNLTASNKFRSHHELQIQYFALQFMLEINQAVPIWTETREQCFTAQLVAYCGIEANKELSLETLRRIETNKPTFFSMNDSVSEGEWDTEVETALHNFFERLFPEKAPFEL